MLGALMLIGGAASGIGQLMAGNAAEAAGEFNADVLRQNARTVRQQGARTEEMIRRKQALFKGQQRAAIAQSGVKLDTGSALDVQEQSEIEMELDVMTQRYETEMRSLGLMTQATMAETQGDEAQRASYFGAAGSILGSAGTYAMLK